MCAAFFYSRLSNLCWSYIFILLCSKLWYCKAEFFYLSVLKNYHAYTYNCLQIFRKYSHTFKKQRPPLLGLSSKVYFWPLVHLYRSDFFNSLPISLTEWPENRKNRCLSSRALKHKQCRPSFSWSNREIKRKRQKKNENRKPTKWAGKVWREKNSSTCTSRAKLQKHYNFFKS